MQTGAKPARRRQRCVASPTVRLYRTYSSLRGKTLGACKYRNMTAGAWGFMLAFRMCRFEDASLLSSSLRLTHILFAVRRSDRKLSPPESLRPAGAPANGCHLLGLVAELSPKLARGPAGRGDFGPRMGVLLVLTVPGYLGTSPPSRLASGSVSSQGRWSDGRPPRWSSLDSDVKSRRRCFHAEDLWQSQVELELQVC